MAFLVSGEELPLYDERGRCILGRLRVEDLPCDFERFAQICHRILQRPRLPPLDQRVIAKATVAGELLTVLHKPLGRLDRRLFDERNDALSAGGAFLQIPPDFRSEGRYLARGKRLRGFLGAHVAPRFRNLARERVGRQAVRVRRRRPTVAAPRDGIVPRAGDV
jgi:hypothetical protein